MRLPVGSIIILVCGLTALIPGLMVLVGLGSWVHEMLDEPIGGIALIAIGMCCVLAAAFPIVATYLTRKVLCITPFDEADG